MEEDFEVVAQVADGDRALDILHQGEPDILLMDLRMPGLHGRATVQRLQGSISRTRVIVLTAFMREPGRAAIGYPGDCIEANRGYSSRACGRFMPARYGWIRT